MSNPNTEQPDEVVEAWRLQREGIDTVNAGRPADGAAILRRGLELVGWIEGLVFTAPDAKCQVVARLLGCLAHAEAELGRGPYGLQLLDVAETLVAPCDQGILVNQRGYILRICGRNIDALRSYGDAEPLLASEGMEPYLVRMLLNRGSVYVDLGRYRDALVDLRRCETLARHHEWPDWLAKVMHALGSAQRGLGDVPEALVSFSQAESLYALTAPDLLPQLALTRGITLREAGLRHEAARHLDNAIDELEELGRVRQLLNCEVHRARLAVETNDLDVALQLAIRARHRAQGIGATALSDWVDRTRKEAEFKLGAIGDDFISDTLSLASRLRSSTQDDVAELAELLAARAAIRVRDFEIAKRIASARSRMSGDQLLTANATRHLVRAELSRAQENRRTALSHLRTGLARIHRYRESFGSLELQAGVSSLGTELAEMGLGLALESHRPSTVYTWAERSRGQAFRLPSVRPSDGDEIANMVARVRELRAYIRQARQEGISATAEKTECDDLEAELRQRDWQTSGPGSSAPEVKPHQVHEALAEGSGALVSFIHHNGQLHALTMVNGRNKLHDLGTVPDIEESLKRLVADLNAATGRQLPERMATAVRSSIQRQSEALDDRLFAPLRRRIGDRELVIVPTKSLYSLPWNILPTLRGRPVTVSPSAAVWLMAHKHEPAAMGNPLLASGPDLSLAEAELDTISEHYYGTVVLRDSEATPDNILSRLDGAPIAHLAAHGLHEPDNFLFSRLDFADGPLMAHDIARLKTPPSHVTLSACDVGQSKVSVGDETLGFTAALLYAGTRTVVSSVAKVEHDVAANIMTAYHANVVAGMAPAHALAQAADGYDLNPFVCYGASLPAFGTCPTVVSSAWHIKSDLRAYLVRNADHSPKQTGTVVSLSCITRPSAG